MASASTGSNTAGYIILAILIVFCIGGLIWFYLVRRRLQQCESSEHTLCPSYFCSHTDRACVPAASAYGTDAGAAFRTNTDGHIQCQTQTLNPTVSRFGAADRIAPWT